MELHEITRKKDNHHIRKQGPCGKFCVKYWLGSGCDDCIDRKPKLFIYEYV